MGRETKRKEWKGKEDKERKGRKRKGRERKDKEKEFIWAAARVIIYFVSSRFDIFWEL